MTFFESPLLSFFVRPGDRFFVQPLGGLRAPMAALSAATASRASIERLMA
jgi:hypothetical protein